jgi:hypothetical protein
MAEPPCSDEQIAWSARLVAVQRCIRLARSADERQHSYPGYVLCVQGTCGDETEEFPIAIGKGTHEKHRFEAFSYGPKICPLYRAGPARNVPGRKGLS